jgi:hypothetical protein
VSDEALASHFDRLRGRILGLIESWGLPPVQERGCKQIFKSLTYDMEAEIYELFRSQQEELEELRLIHQTTANLAQN